MVAWLCCFWACGKAEHGRIKPMAAEKQRGGGLQGFNTLFKGIPPMTQCYCTGPHLLQFHCFPVLPQTGV